jgi:hypothetical protein
MKSLGVPVFALVALGAATAIIATPRDARAAPLAPTATPRPEVTSEPGRPRGGLLVTILAWPDATYAHGARIKLKLVVSNVSGVPIRTNLVYQPLTYDVRVSVVAHESSGPELKQVENPFLNALGPPPATLLPGEIREYEIPVDRYTPDVTKPGAYDVVVRLRVGDDNGAAVWHVTNRVVLDVR